jgi:hypothetical protein
VSLAGQEQQATFRATVLNRGAQHSFNERFEHDLPCCPEVIKD